MPRLDLTLQKIKQTVQLLFEKNNYNRDTLNKEQGKIIHPCDYKAVHFCISMNDFVLAVEIHYSTVRDMQSYKEFDYFGTTHPCFISQGCTGLFV